MAHVSRGLLVLSLITLPALCIATVSRPSAAAATAPALSADDPSIDLYVAKCASCHTVGKGDRVGPDLAGVHTRRDAGWLRTMIQAPSTLLDSDAEARQLLADYNGVRMPDLGLSDDEVTLLVQLIERCSDGPCDLAGKFIPVTEATAADVELGRKLFIGHVEFENSGAPCLSCHDVATRGTPVPGGRLSRDLTHAFARLGDEGLDAALKSPSYKLMNKVFADHPLEKKEVFAVRAFLHDANRSPAAPDDYWSVLIIAIIATFGVLIGLNALWSRRLLGVRSGITSKGNRS